MKCYSGDKHHIFMLKSVEHVNHVFVIIIACTNVKMMCLFSHSLRVLDDFYYGISELETVILMTNDLYNKY